MKKLFISMMALAAFVACQSEFDGADVNMTQSQSGVNYGGTHTIYAEVGVGETTKATYGDDLQATWEEGDQIALLQEHADYNKTFSVVNKLNIKEGVGTSFASFNGDISVDATSPRVYHIAYPAEAVSFNVVSTVSKASNSSYATKVADSTFDGTMGYYSASADYKYTYNTTLNITVPTSQSGKWTPYMYASTSEAVSSMGVGAKTLTTLTGAIAIRAFETDGVTPKQLKSVTITSSDAAIAGVFSGSAESSDAVAITGAYTSDSYSTISDNDINAGLVNWPGANRGRAAADELLQSAAQAYVPTSTTVTKAMTLSFAGTEKSVSATNLDTVAADADGNYTYYVNVAPATVGILSIEAIAMDGSRVVCTYRNQTFRASARKGFLIRWESAEFSCDSIDTWIEDYSADSSFNLEGSTIYANNLKVKGVDADHVLALGLVVDGELYGAQSGVLEVGQVKVDGLASGVHEAYAYAKVLVNGMERELVDAAGEYTVTTIPTATAIIRSSYSNNGNKDLTNSIDGRTVQVTAGLSDAAISSNFVASCKFRYNSAVSNITFGTTNPFTWALGSYDCSVEVTLTNGYTCSTPLYTTHVTGIPYTMNVTANDSWNPWTVNKDVKWNNGDRETTALRIGYALGSSGNTGASSVTKSFYLPADTSVRVKCEAEARGSSFIVNIETKYNCYISGSSAGTATAKGDKKYSSVSINKVMTMTSANPTIQHHNSNSTNSACSYVKSCSILYE